MARRVINIKIMFMRILKRLLILGLICALIYGGYTVYHDLQIEKMRKLAEEGKISLPNDPERTKDNKNPWLGLPYQIAVIKKKDKDNIYIRYVDSYKGDRVIKEKGDVIKLKVTPKAYIYIMNTDYIAKRASLNKIPVKAFIRINTFTRYDDPNEVKYIMWDPLTLKDKRYL